MSLSASPSKIPELHGHRGCRGLRPENTLPAFLHALALGVDVLEMDVIISADKQVVVSHEPWLNPHICLGPDKQRIQNSPQPEFNLYQMPYAIISRCDCSLQHPVFPEQLSEPSHKPLLRDVLLATEAASRSLGGRQAVRYAIEIKSAPASDAVYHPAPAAFLSLVMAELHLAQVVTRTTLLCFDMRILRLAQQLPNLSTSLLVEADQAWLPSIQALGFLPTTFGPDFTSVTPAAVQLLRSSFPSLRLVPWTVNDPADMLTLSNLGVDGITTDYPDRFQSLFKAIAS